MENKAHSRIPKIPINSGVRNKLMKPSSSNENVRPKVAEVTRNRVISRRSKSFIDFKRPVGFTRLNSIPPNIKNSLPPLASAPKGLKRGLDLPIENNSTEPKQIKVVPKKPASYDYKARFQLLQENHVKLKSDLTEISGKYKASCEELNRCSSENEKLQTEIDTLKIELENSKIKDDVIIKLKEELRILKGEMETSNNQIKAMEIKLCKTEEKLQNTENRSIILKTELENTSVTINTLERELKETCEKLLDETQQKEMYKSLVLQQDINRKKMLNLIQDLKGNIRVFCRVRPPIDDEKDKFLCQLKYVDECTLELIKQQKGRSTKNEFVFDKVFTPNSRQEDVFFELEQLIESALDGYNVCIFAYGQTGSGKTYTMQGGTSRETYGMIPRAVQSIFEWIESKKLLGWSYEIEASFLEIYNERIYDLLVDHMNQKSHEIRMLDSKNTDVYVTNLTTKTISSTNELMYLLRIAQQNRSVAATHINEFSSRSHSVAKITLTGMNSANGDTYTGSLNLVDLAGSESAKMSESSRLAETKNINKSLANLSNVILALQENQDHIPFRNSKLTYLLMPALRGNSKTLMLVNISPFEENCNESLNSLRFAAKVNQCKTGKIRRNKT